MRTSEALLGKTKTALLLRLYSKPNESVHLRELVRSVNMGSGTVQKEVEMLTDRKLITKTRIGNRCFYRANKESRFFPELRSIVSKDALEDVSVVIKTALKPFTSKIRMAFVYGSVARKEAGPDSDIDLMVVGDATQEDLAPRLIKAQEKLHREINPTVYSFSDFQTTLDKGNYFLMNVMQNKRIPLVGEVHYAGDV